MRWSVGIEAEGDRVLTPRGGGRAGRRGRRQLRHRHRDRHQPLRRPAARGGGQPGRGDRARRPSEFARAAAAAGLAGAPDRPGRGRQRGRGGRTAAGDQAGLAGGLPVRGAAAAGRLDPAAGPAVYAILYKPEPDAKPERYAVIYVGHADDLSAERFPFQHPRAACWVRRAGSKWKVYICTYEVPGGGPGHREQISPRARPRSTSRAATTSSTTRPGRTSGSASTRRRRPARSPARAGPRRRRSPARAGPDAAQRRPAATPRDAAARTTSPQRPLLLRGEADRVVQPGAAGARRRAGPARATAGSPPAPGWSRR